MIRCALIIIVFGLLSCSGGKVRVPNKGVELSKTEGISFIRVSEPLAEGRGRFELNDSKIYELEAFSLDIISLIELIAPNYRVSVRTEMAGGRYDFHIDAKKFPAESAIMQRYTLQQASYKEIAKALKIKIKMEVAKREVIVSR